MRRNTRNHSPDALHRARELRNEMSASEKFRWEFLRKERLGFKRQASVGRYTLDFYGPAASLCVEVDGEQHALRQRQDEERDHWLAQQGVLTIRVPSLDLFEETGLVGARWVARIRETCEARAKRP